MMNLNVYFNNLSKFDNCFFVVYDYLFSSKKAYNYVLNFEKIFCMPQFVSISTKKCLTKKYIDDTVIQYIVIDDTDTILIYIDRIFGFNFNSYMLNAFKVNFESFLRRNNINMQLEYC